MALVPRACIIDAGSSGITEVKVFHERGIPFDCFEMSDRIGGNWAFGNKNGLSTAYRTLHINRYRAGMQYVDFPMPSTMADYPHHTQIIKYFNAYVDHFGLRDRITFNTGVARAALHRLQGNVPVLRHQVHCRTVQRSAAFHAYSRSWLRERLLRGLRPALGRDHAIGGGTTEADR